MPDEFQDAPPPKEPPKELGAMGCALVLLTAFLGWLFAGVQLAISSLAMRDAAKDLLATTDEALVGQWFGWLICAFLFGAALGGLVFGQIGDWFGRSRAMGLSILWYSVLSGLTYFVQTPEQLLVMRFLTCMGIGGMWPNGIALISEAWPNISRPFLAGIMGTAANVGITLFAALASVVDITTEQWRWVMLVGAGPAILALFVWWAVPESPKWLAGRAGDDKPDDKKPTAKSLPASRFAYLLVIGIALGTVPLFGGWGSSNWVTPWASEVGENLDTPDPGLKARIHLARSLTGSVGSLLGGALAWLMGRQLCYFLMSTFALLSAQYMFWFSSPGEVEFLYWTAVLGFFSGVFFGWLPLCLPEMFPTRVRSTGSGVSFNFGRILTAFGVLGGAWLIQQFDGDYAKIGRVTSLVYAIGMIVIWFAPLKGVKSLED